MYQRIIENLRSRLLRLQPPPLLGPQEQVQEQPQEQPQDEPQEYLNDNFAIDSFDPIKVYENNQIED